MLLSEKDASVGAEAGMPPLPSPPAFLVCLLCLLAFSLAAPGAAPAGQPVDSAVLGKVIQRMTTAYDQVNDYTAVLHKQIAKDGVLEPAQAILIKFKKPFSVYLKWIAEPHKGREVIFEKGKNSDRAWVHNGSFPNLTLCLDPDTCKALSDSRHTILEVGLGYLIQLISRDFKRALRRPQDKVIFLDHGLSEVNGRPGRCLETVTPQNPDSGYYGGRARVCLDQETGLPSQVTIWDHQGRLWEKFAYTDIKTNVGLRDADFDPKNPAYDFD